MKPYLGGYKVRIDKTNVFQAWKTLFSTSINNMTFRFSTSIENFAERVRGQYGVYEWHFLRSLFDATVFLGAYHEGDWLRVILHRGKRLIFWCGGDILRLQKKKLWQLLLKCVKIDHVCENEVEQKALKEMGFEARIHPILFFDDWTKYPLSYKDPNGKPHVWLTCHPGREKEYGVGLVEEIADSIPEVTFHIFGVKRKSYNMYGKHNVIYHGQVPSEEMDAMIRGYHAGLRTCEFDGCSHTVTKGVLLGQWSINRIPYPHTDSYKTKEELITLLKNLKNKTKPNIAGRKHWIKVVSEFPWQ